MTVVGVDACKSGWIAVVLRQGERPESLHLPEIRSLASAVPDTEVVGIDIPIGLPLAGRRAADVQAKAILGLRQNSVFFTPVRAALEAPDHATATKLSVDLTGVGMSQQSYALRHKIFEVESWLGSAPCGVWEVHPEVSFSFLLGQPANAPKKTWSGMIERKKALCEVGIDLDGASGNAGSVAAVDDMLDAGVAAWTAKRLFDGVARSIPEPPEFDGNGRAVAIWA